VKLALRLQVLQVLHHAAAAAVAVWVMLLLSRWLLLVLQLPAGG
jgi:hypothetical protein